MDDRRLLADLGGLRITHDFEDAVLEWAGGEAPLGDHYGDPQCALIGPDGDWCAVGGEGLSLFALAGSPPRITGRIDLWRRGAPPPDGARCWFVGEARLIDGDRLRVVAETADGARTFEVAARTGAWRAAAG